MSELAGNSHQQAELQMLPMSVVTAVPNALCSADIGWNSMSRPTSGYSIAPHSHRKVRFDTWQAPRTPMALASPSPQLQRGSCMADSRPLESVRNFSLPAPTSSEALREPLAMSCASLPSFFAIFGSRSSTVSMSPHSSFTPS